MRPVPHGSPGPAPATPKRRQRRPVIATDAPAASVLLPIAAFVLKEDAAPFRERWQRHISGGCLGGRDYGKGSFDPLEEQSCARCLARVPVAILVRTLAIGCRTFMFLGKAGERGAVGSAARGRLSFEDQARGLSRR